VTQLSWNHDTGLIMTMDYDEYNYSTVKSDALR